MRFLTLGWASIFNRPSLLICCLLATIATTHAQIRTVTKQPYPTGANSVAWITNVPYVEGGGPQQQLDLYIPTQGEEHAAHCVRARRRLGAWR